MWYQSVKQVRIIYEIQTSWNQHWPILIENTFYQFSTWSTPWSTLNWWNLWNQSQEGIDFINQFLTLLSIVAYDMTLFCISFSNKDSITFLQKFLSQKNIFYSWLSVLQPLQKTSALSRSCDPGSSYRAVETNSKKTKHNNDKLAYRCKRYINKYRPFDIL